MTRFMKNPKPAKYSSMAQQDDNLYATPMMTAVAASNGSSSVASTPLVVASRVPHASSQPNQQYTVTAIDSPTTPAYFKVQAPVTAPESMDVAREGGALIIKRKWFNSSIYFVSLFAILWNGFMIVWNFIAISEGIIEMALFAILHDCAGLFLIYIVVVTLLNSTFITVRNGTLLVENRPIQGCHAPKVFDTQPIRDIHCKRNVSVSSSENRGVNTSYDVRALDANRVETVIVDNLASLEEALFIEQELEIFLGLGQVIVDATAVGAIV